MRTRHGIIGLAVLLASVSFGAQAGGVNVAVGDVNGDAGSFIGGTDGYYGGFNWQGGGKFVFQLGGQPGQERDAYTELSGSGMATVQTNTILDWMPRATEPQIGGMPFFQFVSADFDFVPGPGMLREGVVTLKGFQGTKLVSSIEYYSEGTPSVVAASAPASVDFFAGLYDRLEIEVLYRGSATFGSWGGQLRMDNLTVAGAVPEPSTYVLMAAGLAAVAWGARQRSRA